MWGDNQYGKNLDITNKNNTKSHINFLWNSKIKQFILFFIIKSKLLSKVCYFDNRLKTLGPYEQNKKNASETGSERAHGVAEGMETLLQ